MIPPPEPTEDQLATMLDISESAALAMLAQGGTEDQALEFGADQALAWLWMPHLASMRAQS